MPPPESSRLLLVRSPFLLIRFVIFSLLVYLGLTALGFAAWGVGANRAAGAHVSGAFVLIIFNSVATFLCIVASFKVSLVGVECFWTGIFSSLQIAASIYVTLVGPPEFCGVDAQLAACASATILVPISWLATMLLLSYFIAIMTLCIAHLRSYPALWSMSLYDIAWFAEDNTKDKHSSVPQLPPLNTSPSRLSVVYRRHSTSSLPRDVENQVPVPVSTDRENPLPSPTPSNVWWGRLLPGRAGKDHPFSIRRVRRPEFQWRSNNEGDLGYPQYAPTTYPTGVSQSPYPPITEVALNEDEPIPLGHRSQWVRAVKAPGPYVPHSSAVGRQWP